MFVCLLLFVVATINRGNLLTPSLRRHPSHHLRASPPVGDQAGDRPKPIVKLAWKKRQVTTPADANTLPHTRATTRWHPRENEKREGGVRPRHQWLSLLSMLSTILWRFLQNVTAAATHSNKKQLQSTNSKIAPECECGCHTKGHHLQGTNAKTPPECDSGCHRKIHHLQSTNAETDPKCDTGCHMETPPLPRLLQNVTAAATWRTINCKALTARLLQNVTAAAARTTVDCMAPIARLPQNVTAAATPKAIICTKSKIAPECDSGCHTERHQLRSPNA